MTLKVVCVILFIISVMVIWSYFYDYDHDDNDDDSKTPLLVINLCKNWCGMGNQMFRYAAGLGLRYRHPNVCVLGFGEREWHPTHTASAMAMHVDILIEPLNACPASMSYFSWFRFEFKLKEHLDTFIFRPPHSMYHPLPLHIKRSVTLVDGCMQSFKYFMDLPHPFFRLKEQDHARAWLRAQGVASVVVHVRRQDKLRDGSSVAPIEFYETALTRVGNPTRFAVCTDDPLWVQEQRVFRNATISKHRNNPGFDMALLAAATDAVIIGIGTFGWWGAYLSSAKQKVFYSIQYQGRLASAYREADYIPYGHQSGWMSCCS